MVRPSAPASLWSTLLGMLVGWSCALRALAVRPDLYSAAMVGLAVGLWTGTMHFLVSRRRWVWALVVITATVALIVWVLNMLGPMP